MSANPLPVIRKGFFFFFCKKSIYYNLKLVSVSFNILIILEGVSGEFLPKGERIRGHEFHYYDSEDNGEACLAIKPVTGKSYSCIIANENCFIGFPHLYYPSNPIFAKNFVKKAKEYRKNK